MKLSRGWTSSHCMVTCCWPKERGNQCVRGSRLRLDLLPCGVRSAGPPTARVGWVRPVAPPNSWRLACALLKAVEMTLMMIGYIPLQASFRANTWRTGLDYSTASTPTGGS